MSDETKWCACKDELRTKEDIENGKCGICRSIEDIFDCDCESCVRAQRVRIKRMAESVE